MKFRPLTLPCVLRGYKCSGVWGTCYFCPILRMAGTTPPEVRANVLFFHLCFPSRFSLTQTRLSDNLSSQQLLPKSSSPLNSQSSPWRLQIPPHSFPFAPAPTVPPLHTRPLFPCPQCGFFCPRYGSSRPPRVVSSPPAAIR